MKWHTLEDSQSGFLTTKIRDEAKKRGFETDYSRVGWTTIVDVKCITEQWEELLAHCRGS